MFKYVDIITLNIIIHMFNFLFPILDIVYVIAKINNPVITNKYLAYIIGRQIIIDTAIAPNITKKYVIIAYLAGFKLILFSLFLFLHIIYIMYMHIINPYIPAIQLLICILLNRFPVNWNVNNSINVSGNFTPTQNPFDTCDTCNNSDNTHGKYKIICIIACTIKIFKFFVNFFSFIAFFYIFINNSIFITPAVISP